MTTPAFVKPARLQALYLSFALTLSCRHSSFARQTVWKVSELLSHISRTPVSVQSTASLAANAGLMGALQALKQQLTRLGTGLLVKIGRADEIIPQLAVEHGVCQIIAEEEVEYRCGNDLAPHLLLFAVARQ